VGTTIPTLSYGPASEQPREDSLAIGRERSSIRYACSGAYDKKEYDKCEVGDLSDKYGSLTVHPDGTLSKYVKDDHLPALDYQHNDKNEDPDPFKFASIVFHYVNDASIRVLCGKLAKIT
jgi:hypothetical protein